MSSQAVKNKKSFFPDNRLHVMYTGGTLSETYEEINPNAQWRAVPIGSVIASRRRELSYDWFANKNYDGCL